MKTLNFDENKIQELDLDTLKITFKENDVFGNPLREIYHFQVIENIMEICRKNGLSVSVQEMFAANNNSKQFPGVSTSPVLVKELGTGAPQAHILRRVYTTLRIQEGETNELTTNIAIADHQDGLQVAFGATVKICKNLCILGADKMVSNFGNRKISNDKIFESVENWMANFGNYQERDLQVIAAMRQINCTKADVMRLIGMLTAIRVSFDNGIGEVRQQLNSYPLNQAQISNFTERYLKKLERERVEDVTLWDVYNLGTDIYKPASTEIPNILPQTASLFEVLNDSYKIV